jgi:hypothetical protein
MQCAAPEPISDGTSGGSGSIGPMGGHGHERLPEDLLAVALTLAMWVVPASFVLARRRSQRALVRRVLVGLFPRFFDDRSVAGLGGSSACRRGRVVCVLGNLRNNPATKRLLWTAKSRGITTTR